MLNGIIITMAPVFLPSEAPLLPRRLESARLELTSSEQVGRFLELTLEVTGR